MWTIRYDDAFGNHHECRGLSTREMNYIVRICIDMRLAVYVEYEN